MKPHYDIPNDLGAIKDRDILEGYSSDPLHVAMPDALVRPQSVEEVSRILSYCHSHGIPVTPCGNQTSLTAAAIADHGILMSSEKLESGWRIHEDPEQPGRWLAYVGAAANLAAFQDSIAAQGFFYPPDPTSREEILVGATVATNASGEDSFKYGSTRRWVRGLQYVRPDGEIRRVMRYADEKGSAHKNTCGYPFRESEVDLLIGCEGTLGVITEVIVEVLPFVPEFVSMFVFFENEGHALWAVGQMAERSSGELRCCEYMDRAALDILVQGADGFQCPETAEAALYLKLEFAGDCQGVLETWLDHLEGIFDHLQSAHLLDAVQAFTDAPAQRMLRHWRHLIPATINERAAQYRDYGGGKVGTDWYVPLNRLTEMFTRVRDDQDGADWVVFGHIGNGHPHFNFIAKDLREYQRDRELLFKHCQLAVELGGGVSGEHGLGKKKSQLLAMQYSERDIQEMVAIKRKYDPQHIMAPGNIFPDSLFK